MNFAATWKKWFCSKWFLPPSRFHRENAGHVGTSEGGKLHLSGQTSITWRQRCKDQQKFKICFSIFSGGGHWWPNQRIALFTQTADLQLLIRSEDAGIRMHIAAHQMHGFRCSKSDQFQRLFFPHFQVPIKIFSFNHVLSILEYFSTNLQDWIWFCLKLRNLRRFFYWITCVPKRSLKGPQKIRTFSQSSRCDLQNYESLTHSLTHWLTEV